MNIDKRSLHAINHAKANLGLPLFLRSLAGPKRHGLPVLFGFVKSKCFNDTGERTCKKANHSCIRRVLNASQCPHAFGWKVIGRAVRGTMQAIQCREVFDQSRAIPAVTACLEELQPEVGFARGVTVFSPMACPCTPPTLTRRSKHAIIAALARLGPGHPPLFPVLTTATSSKYGGAGNLLSGLSPKVGAEAGGSLA